MKPGKEPSAPPAAEMEKQLPLPAASYAPGLGGACIHYSKAKVRFEWSTYLNLRGLSPILSVGFQRGGYLGPLTSSLLTPIYIGGESD